MVSSMTTRHVDLPMIVEGAAWICLIWSVFVFLVNTIGITQLYDSPLRLFL